jgi:hypothetical protein
MFAKAIATADQIDSEIAASADQLDGLVNDDQPRLLQLLAMAWIAKEFVSHMANVLEEAEATRNVHENRNTGRRGRGSTDQ